MKKIIFALLFCLLLTGCQASPISKTDFMLGTFVTITLYDGGSEEILDECMEKCHSYEKLFSPTIEGSDVYRINHAEGEGTSVSFETAALIKEGLCFGGLSDGRFDISIYPASSLWKFGEEKPSPPHKDALKDATEHIDYRSISLNGNNVVLKDPKAAIDLGGIAKGYIADRLGEFLKERGVGSAVINLGGNILCVGEKKDKKPFRIGIQKPFDKQGKTLGTLYVGEKSVVTSGIYERYFKTSETIYHHLLDPKTGYPIQNDLWSVTVISDSSVKGDAFSTILFSMGLKDGLAFAESEKGIEAIFVDNMGKVHTTDGIGEEILFEMTDD